MDCEQALSLFRSGVFRALNSTAPCVSTYKQPFAPCAPTLASHGPSQGMCGRNKRISRRFVRYACRPARIAWTKSSAHAVDLLNVACLRHYRLWNSHSCASSSVSIIGVRHRERTPYYATTPLRHYATAFVIEHTLAYCPLSNKEIVYLLQHFRGDDGLCRHCAAAVNLVCDVLHVCKGICACKMRVKVRQYKMSTKYDSTKFNLDRKVPGRK